MRDERIARAGKGKGAIVSAPSLCGLIDLWLGREEPSFIAEASFVKAPLNSRVVSNANIVGSKGKAKQESLDRLPLEIQEALILEDLLFVLMVRL